MVVIGVTVKESLLYLTVVVLNYYNCMTRSKKPQKEHNEEVNRQFWVKDRGLGWNELSDPVESNDNLFISNRNTNEGDYSEIPELLPEAVPSSVLPSPSSSDSVLDVDRVRSE